MRKFTTAALAAATLSLASLPATAADLITKAPPLVVATWTGFYAGVHVGAGWGTVESDFPIGPIALPISSHGTNGAIGGVQGGYNYQSGWAVFGLEGSWSWSGIKGQAPCLVVLTCSTDTKWIASFTGRVGGLVAGNTLVFVKAGGTWARDDYAANILGLASFTGSSDRWGWVLGTGAEYKFTPNWSGVIEYNYNDYGNHSVPISIGGVAIGNANIKNQIHLVKAGLNYKFW